MEASNKVGSIITKHIVGQCPAIRLNNDRRRYELTMVVSNTAYANIMEECQRVGLHVDRKDIDEFVRCIYDFDSACIPVYTDNLKDEDLLAGERLRLHGPGGLYADLLKVRSQEYLCTDGVCAGQILNMTTSAIDLSMYDPDFVIMSMELLPPTDAHYLLDYRYLSLYKARVADSIEELYRAADMAYMDGAIVSSFGDLLRLCGDLGQSTWTLRGIIDFLSLRNNC